MAVALLWVMLFASVAGGVALLRHSFGWSTAWFMLAVGAAAGILVTRG